MHVKCTKWDTYIPPKKMDLSSGYAYVAVSAQRNTLGTCAGTDSAYVLRWFRDTPTLRVMRYILPCISRNHSKSYGDKIVTIELCLLF